MISRSNKGREKKEKLRKAEKLRGPREEETEGVSSESQRKKLRKEKRVAARF